jgi:hypothetical protein
MARELGRDVPMDAFKAEAVLAFEAVFGRTLRAAASPIALQV